LGKLESQNARAISFANCEDKYAELLREFGTTGNLKSGPENAFYRLKRDAGGSIWAVSDPAKKLNEDSSGGVLITALRDPTVEAGFTSEVLEIFDQHPDLISRLAEYILSSHFPDTLHSDILNSVGLSSSRSISPSRRRDPNFRPRVLNAYEYQCAVCGFSLKLGTLPVALEAAHIKWHQAGGPEEPSNGLALCSLHHKLFDLGAFTISDDFCLEESNQTNSAGKNTVSDFRGQKIFLPQEPNEHPDKEYLRWHKSEVFKGKAR
jgi:putative restriction endonuclease